MDLRLSIFGEDKASSAFDSVGSAARQAAKALYDFSKESVKAALDQEKADRQLALAAKELHRKLSGIEQSAEYCALAEKRLVQDLLPMGECQ